MGNSKIAQNKHGPLPDELLIPQSCYNPGVQLDSPHSGRPENLIASKSGTPQSDLAKRKQSAPEF